MIAGAAEGADWLPALCTGLHNRGHDVRAIVDRRPGDLGRRLVDAGVPTGFASLSLRRPLADDRAPGPLRYPADAAHLGRVGAGLVRDIARQRPDVIVTHFLNGAVAGRIGGWLAGVPVRLAMVASPFHLEAPLLRRIDMLTLPLDTGVIAGSERIRDLYLELGVPGDKIDVVYYGADAVRFDPARADRAAARESLGAGPETPLIGHVAHFYAPIGGSAAPAATRSRGLKGHDVVLAAVPRVLQSHPDARFVLVGDARGAAAAEHRADLQQLAARLGVQDRVAFCGPRTDVPDVLAALDVAIQPSLAENLGGTIEALLMQAPLVATRVGGMPESVRHEETGLLVEPDDPPGLADAIVRLLDDRALARRLGETGRVRMLERFTLDRTIDDLDVALQRRAARR
jgi:glycosyltransferase involved in cell wall biosynthesis